MKADASGGIQISPPPFYVRKKMNDNIKDLAKQAGFKIFGNHIVAADGNSSGAATICLGRFVELMVDQILDITEPMPGSGDPDDVALARVQKEIKEKFGIK